MAGIYILNFFRLGAVLVASSPALAANPCDLTLRGAPAVAALHVAGQSAPQERMPALNLQSQEPLSFLSTEEAWRLSQRGLANLSLGLHRMDNLLFYLTTGLIAKEHVLLGGQGGGGKTFSATHLLRAQVGSMMASVKQVMPNEAAEFGEDIEVFLQELIKLSKEDPQAGPDRHLFALQMHQMMSEISLLGGVNPFVMVEKGTREIDYSRAMIAAKNFFVLLDEIDKAPVSVQMTLLSVLAEREAMRGNEVVRTMLESAVFTTNKTLGELINDAKSYEIGGRQALLDRISLNLFVPSTAASAEDELAYLLKPKLNRSLIDLRSLRPLLDQILIPKELFEMAAEIISFMDQHYTAKYNKAIEASSGIHPRYYPNFSGSTRSVVKTVDLWKAAFLAHKLLSGVPFEQLDLQMRASDLVDLSPALLQGGPETFLPLVQTEVEFSLNDGIATVSNVGRDDHLSLGYYDPYTQIFSFESFHIENGLLQTRKVYFDIDNKRLVSMDSNLLEQIDDKEDLVQRLSDIHKAQSSVGLAFKLGPYIEELLLNGPLRTEAREELESVVEFHSLFAAAINNAIEASAQNKLTNFTEIPNFLKSEERFRKEAEELRSDLRRALNAADKNEIIRLAARSVRQFYEEATAKFTGSQATVSSLLEAILGSMNLMMFGGPGSGKTMLGRATLERALEFVNEADKAAINQELAEALIGAKVKMNGDGNRRPYVAQYHPQTAESEVLGHLDLAALRSGRGFVYNADASLSADQVLLVLLDEFEKSSPGVKTACLSILHERAVMRGDELVELAILAIFLTTNSTPSEFMISQGAFSTSFPIFDRIHKLVYLVNKVDTDEMANLMVRKHLKMPIEIHTPLPVLALKPLVKKVEIPTDLLLLMVRVKNQFLKDSVQISEAERVYHNTDPQRYLDFYMNSRGESLRTAKSIFDKELKSDLVVSRILKGQDVDELIEADSIPFSVFDLSVFANALLTKSQSIEIETIFPPDGFMEFRLKETPVSRIADRLTIRDKQTLDRIRQEAERLIVLLNAAVQDHFKEWQEVLVAYPGLFSEKFGPDEARKKFLEIQGMTPVEVR